MAENIIALIFPEYKDEENPVTSKDWTTDELYDDETIGKQIKNVAQFVDFFKDEECRMVFDSENIRAYLYPVDTIPEAYPSRRLLLRTALKGLENWRSNRKSTIDTECNIHYEINPAKRNVLDLKNETCKNREKRNVLKISHTRHFKTTKKQSKTGCFYSF